MPKQRLTDRQLASGVTLTDLVHIVITGDTSQSSAGSSYKATIQQISDVIGGGGGTFTGGTVSGPTIFTNGLSANTISATTYLNLPTFTGNTSGDCITDLFVTNLYGCSPLHIEPSGLNNIYLVENGGNVGIGTTATTVTLDVAGETRLSGSGENVLTVIGSGCTQPLFKVEGSSGELFSITDSLVGELFTVNDISAIPILQVFDDATVHMGSSFAPSLNTTVKLNPGTGLSTVYSLPMTSGYTGAWFDYTVTNTGGTEAGTIMSVFSGNTAVLTEFGTTEIGDTSDIAFSVSADTTNAYLQVSAATTGWEVKTIVRSI